MFLKYESVYNKCNINKILFVPGKFIPIHDIKDKESSPHTWG